MKGKDTMELDREIKALEIAAKSKLTRKGNVWTVPRKPDTANTMLI